MSAKITAVTLDGRSRSLTRARAQRLVDSGSHQWQGDRTVREVKKAKAVFAAHDCVCHNALYPGPAYPYPGQPDGLPPGSYHIPAYTYPLPLDFLRMYR